MLPNDTPTYVFAYQCVIYTHVLNITPSHIDRGNATCWCDIDKPSPEPCKHTLWQTVALNIEASQGSKIDTAHALCMPNVMAGLRVCNLTLSCRGFSRWVMSITLCMMSHLIVYSMLIQCVRMILKHGVKIHTVGASMLVEFTPAAVQVSVTQSCRHNGCSIAWGYCPPRTLKFIYCIFYLNYYYHLLLILNRYCHILLIFSSNLNHIQVSRFTDTNIHFVLKWGAPVDVMHVL